ncbi:hypothetical protein BS78_01G277900, partial [Paspalum vaginatum]
QRRATHAYPARCIFSNGAADPSSSPSSGAAPQHHHQIAGSNPRPSETLDPRASALRASGTPEFASNRPIQANRTTGGSSNPAESTGSGRARLGICGFRGRVSGVGWSRGGWTRSDVGRRRREKNLAIRGRERSRQGRGQGQGGAEHSRDGERGRVGSRGGGRDERRGKHEGQNRPCTNAAQG